MMSEEKLNAILENLRKKKENISEMQEGFTKMRGNLDTIELKMDEEVDKLYKAENLFGALPEEQVSNPPPVLDSLLASGSDLTKSALEHSEHFKHKIFTVIGETDLLLGTITVSNTSSNTILNVAASAAKTVALEYPQIEELIKEQYLPSRFEKRKELESELRKLSELMGNALMGAWQTLRDTSKLDRYREAAHSMRDLLSHFLDFLAPNEEVKSVAWYEPEFDEQSGKPRKNPTQRQKAKYAIIGDRFEKTLDEEDLKTITGLITDTRKTYKDLSMLAHPRDAEIFNLTKSYMERCEEVIQTILELRKRYHS